MITYSKSESNVLKLAQLPKCLSFVYGQYKLPKRFKNMLFIYLYWKVNRVFFVIYEHIPNRLLIYFWMNFTHKLFSCIFNVCILHLNNPMFIKICCDSCSLFKRWPPLSRRRKCRKDPIHCAYSTSALLPVRKGATPWRFPLGTLVPRNIRQNGSVCDRTGECGVHVSQ